MAGIFKQEAGWPRVDAPIPVRARQSARIASQKPEESVSGKYFDPLGLV